MTWATSVSRALTTRLAERELSVPEQLRQVYESDLVDKLDGVLLRPDGEGEFSMAWAELLINASAWPLLPNLVPIMMVDEQSFACVIATDNDAKERLPGEGRVVRWHTSLADQYAAFQAGLLDTNAYLYAESVHQELAARKKGFDQIMRIGAVYEREHIANKKRPRDYVVRPIRLACQNVIVGLAAIAQDSSFDGLSVVGWQTCERPHIATHDANRALTVVTLCDAFQNGGTMEIKFDQTAKVDGKKVRHPEGGVPASLRRYARTVGVELSSPDRDGVPAGSISPQKSRELFRAVTPMPGSLRTRVAAAENQLGISPERLCYALLKPIWRDIELDYLLACSDRVDSILQGGAAWEDRIARQAESEVCRAAVMAGMLFRRLNATDAAGADGEVRVIEANSVGVTWECLDDIGAIRFANLGPNGSLPWTDKHQANSETLLIFPRTFVTDELLKMARQYSGGEQRAIVVPSSTEMPACATNEQTSDVGTTGINPADLKPKLIVMKCPDRLADIDKTIEGKLLTARISRG